MRVTRTSGLLKVLNICNNIKKNYIRSYATIPDGQDFKAESENLYFMLTLYLSDHPSPSQVFRIIEIFTVRDRKSVKPGNTPGCSFCWLSENSRNLHRKSIFFFLHEKFSMFFHEKFSVQIKTSSYKKFTAQNFKLDLERGRSV